MKLSICSVPGHLRQQRPGAPQIFGHDLIGGLGHQAVYHGGVNETVPFAGEGPAGGVVATGNTRSLGHLEEVLLTGVEFEEDAGGLHRLFRREYFLFGLF